MGSRTLQGTLETGSLKRLRGITEEHLRLSMRTQYALRALTELAMNDGAEPVKAWELAEKENIPVKFLEQVLASLKNGRLVISRRGCNGGYVLARPPSEITLGELIRLMEGPESAATSLADPMASTGLREIMEEVDRATNYLLDRFSLEEICRRSRLPDPEQTGDELL